MLINYLSHNDKRLNDTDWADATVLEFQRQRVLAQQACGPAALLSAAGLYLTLQRFGIQSPALQDPVTQAAALIVLSSILAAIYFSFNWLAAHAMQWRQLRNPQVKHNTEHPEILAGVGVFLYVMLMVAGLIASLILQLDWNVIFPAVAVISPTVPITISAACAKTLSFLYAQRHATPGASDLTPPEEANT